MNMRKIGHRVIAFEGAGEGGAGGTVPAANPAPAPAGAHPVAAPWADAAGVWTFGEGEAAKPWYALVPEDGARQTLEAKGYKNPAELGLAYHNLTKLQRGDPTVIGLPGADATPEDLNAFYSKLGRPDKPEGYEFKFGEGVQADDRMVEFARSTFYEAGLTPKQAQLVADKWNAFAADMNGQSAQADQAVNQQDLDALATKWGADLETNKAAGLRAMQALGVDASLVARVEQNIGSAAVVELLALIGRKSDEGGFVGQQQTNPNDPATMNKEQAQARIDQLHGDVEFQKKFFDKNHPGHAEAVSLMERLYSRV